MKYQIREAAYIALLLILSITSMILMREISNEPEPQITKPPFVDILEFDIADHLGERGKLYVVRAEWVYLSAESAEEKMEELCK